MPSGGYNVYPREIEAVLEEHPDVALAAVISIPDAVWDEVGVAFETPGRKVRPDEASLRSWCRERLAPYKTPKRFIVSSSLPLLPIGKVDKQALKDMLANAETL